MPLTPEGRIKRDIKAWLKAKGIWFFMPQNVGLGVSGVPDFICCVPQFCGRLLGIEAKAAGKRNNTTALQDEQIKAIKQAGGLAIVVDDVQQLEEFFHACCTGAEGTGSQCGESGATAGLHPAGNEVQLQGK